MHLYRTLLSEAPTSRNFTNLLSCELFCLFIFILSLLTRSCVASNCLTCGGQALFSESCQFFVTGIDSESLAQVYRRSIVQNLLAKSRRKVLVIVNAMLHSTITSMIIITVMLTFARRSAATCSLLELVMRSLVWRNQDLCNFAISTLACTHKHTQKESKNLLSARSRALENLIEG